MRVVETVRGAVRADQIGVVLPHEHLFVDLISNFGTQLLAFDFYLADVEVAASEAARFKAAGGGCIADVTPGDDVGRNARGLLAVSEALDLHVIMGCGWYRASWYGAEIDKTPTSALAEQLIHEIENGVADTGVKPGIIGEIGADLDYLTAAEERVLRAAARAQLATDRPLTLHARASRVGMQQLDVLEDEGVDLRRVIVGHCDTLPEPSYHRELTQRGAWVEYDTIRGPHEDVIKKRMWLIEQAVELGFAERLLISHDVCTLSHLRARGGTGYDFLLSDFMPMLMSKIPSEDLQDLLMVRNPQAALSFEGAAP